MDTYSAPSIMEPNLGAITYERKAVQTGWIQCCLGNRRNGNVGEPDVMLQPAPRPGIEFIRHARGSVVKDCCSAFQRLPNARPVAATILAGVAGRARSQLHSRATAEVTTSGQAQSIDGASSGIGRPTQVAGLCRHARK